MSKTARQAPAGRAGLRQPEIEAEPVPLAAEVLTCVRASGITPGPDPTRSPEALARSGDQAGAAFGSFRRGLPGPGPGAATVPHSR